MESGKLAGKRALVTGAGTGIGRGVALEFARQGADVVLHYAHSDAGAVSAAEEIRAMGRKTAVFKANFDDVDDVVALGDKTIEFLGGIDCLVNNAGVTLNKPFLEVTREQFDMIFHINIRAQYFLTQRVVRDMLQHGGGAICNMASIHGLQGVIEFSTYAATKGAIISYTRDIAIELAHKGIRINAIAPGMIPVENHSKADPNYSDEAIAEETKNSIPVARPGTPEEIGKVAAFLCSDDAGFIIGQTIVVDGGSTSLCSLFPNFRSKLGMQLGTGYLPGV